MATAFTPHNDEPTLDIESLAPRKALLDQFREALLLCKPPQVLGIHGDWGSGKTSFLHRLMFEITGECSGNRESEERAKKASKAQKDIWDDSKAVAVWFEAWRYQHDDSPVVALLNEIRARFSRPRKFWNEAKKLLKIASTSVLFGFESVTKLVGVSAKTIQEQGEAYEKERRLNPLPTQEVRALLEEAVQELLKSNDAERLLIFIDDLDRCSSASVLSLLEGIKIFLNIKGCVFILGINQHEIERAIARELSKNEFDGEAVAVRAQEYLEKLCGHLVRLPLLDPASQRVLLRSHVKALASEELREAFLGLLTKKEGHAPYDFLPPNPRRIKSFANTVLQIMAAIGERDPATAPRDARALAIVASLHTFHPELHVALQKDTEAFWNAVQLFCQVAFVGATDERKAAAENPHRLLRNTVRPYGVPEAPQPPGPKKQVAYGVKFNALFANPASLDTLFCQQLIADSILIADDLRPFLAC